MKGKYKKSQKTGASRPARRQSQRPQPMMEGVISRSSARFAFFIPDAPDTPDLYIDSVHLNGAMHGDRVCARQIPGKTRGEIVQVLSRAITQVVGTVEKGWLKPDDPHIGADLFIEAGKVDCPEGYKALCEITRYSASRYEQTMCRVKKVLGRPDQRNVDVLSVLYGKGIPLDFSEATQQQCQALPQSPSPEDLIGRRDLRSECIFTIDGAQAKDFDDAVSITVQPDGWTLGVHIADVTHYVTPASPIDQDAVERGTSVYPPGMVVPMLPEALSNRLCSLMPNCDRLTLSAQIRFDAQGAVLEESIFPSVIRSKARLIYEQVNAVLDGSADASLLEKHQPVLPSLLQMQALYQVLAKRRAERGSIDFDLPESELFLDEQGHVTDIRPQQRGVSNRMIEEFMLAANGCAARFAMARNLPFLYRVHEAPDPFKLSQLEAFVQTFGISFHAGDSPAPKDFARLSEQISALPQSTILAGVMLRCMQKARYDFQPLGHFGLATAQYCHFTSPIRRYPDLFIHRVIKSALGGMDNAAQLLFSRQSRAFAEPLSQCEQRAVDAERTVTDIKKAQYMSSRIGQRFDGMITGLASFGLFVTLENLVEGMLPMDALRDDHYDLDAHLNRLIGRHTGRIYRLGDPIAVYVHSIDPMQGHIRFSLLAPEFQPTAPLPEKEYTTPKTDRPDRKKRRMPKRDKRR